MCELMIFDCDSKDIRLKFSCFVEYFTATTNNANKVNELQLNNAKRISPIKLNKK